MTNFDPDIFLNKPIYAFDFQCMIGDIEDFLEFSETTLEWQFRRELLAIKRRDETEGFEPGYREHLETNAEFRFKDSLPLKVRYGALIAFITSVEWAVKCLVSQLKQALPSEPKRKNETVEPIAKLWGDEWQSHFEAIFGVE